MADGPGAIGVPGRRNPFRVNQSAQQWLPAAQHVIQREHDVTQPGHGGGGVHRRTAHGCAHVRGALPDRGIRPRMLQVNGDIAGRGQGLPKVGQALARAAKAVRQQHQRRLASAKGSSSGTADQHRNDPVAGGIAPRHAGWRR